MEKFGIDISAWQRGFDFDRAKAEGVEFAILRGAYHTKKDSCFEDFYAACKARNIPVGVYLYSMATSVAEAKEEAQLLIENVLAGKQFGYPIYMDVEDKVQRKLGKTLLTEIVIAFCETIESAGYYVGIYASTSFFSSYLIEEKLAQYDKWVAQWNTECQYAGKYGLWQFGGEMNKIRSNKIAGVVCDQDYAYKDYPAIMQERKLNGYGKPQPEPQPEEKPAQQQTMKAKDYARFYDKALDGTYRVTASALNVRHGAGIHKKKMTTIPQNRTVKCYGYYSKNLGAKWLFVAFSYNDVYYEGFCHSRYLKKL